MLNGQCLRLTGCNDKASNDLHHNCKQSFTTEKCQRQDDSVLSKGVLVLEKNIMSRLL